MGGVPGVGSDAIVAACSIGGDAIVAARSIGGDASRIGVASDAEDGLESGVRLGFGRLTRLRFRGVGSGASEPGCPPLGISVTAAKRIRTR